MTAPTCGARTWTSSGELVTCDREPGHVSLHSGPVGNDRIGNDRKLWTMPMCAILLRGCDHVWTPEEARSVRDRIQAQLDALDPDAAIAEAKKKAHDAYLRCSVLREQARSTRSSAHESALIAETNAAFHEWEAAVDAWLALVEARDAKDGRT